MENDISKQTSLLQELELGVETVKSALSLIQSIQPNRVPIFLIFLILSTGLERVFKILIGLRRLTDHQPFPSIEELLRYGHDLRKLKGDILSICFDRLKLDSQIKREDYEFLSSNILLNELLNHLSEFGKEGKYVYMDRIADENATGKWLSSRWEEIEAKIVPKNVAIELISKNRLVDYNDKISNELVKCIERLLGALVRTITLGGMNKQANSAGTLLHEFLIISESELGKKKYELFGYTSV